MLKYGKITAPFTEEQILSINECQDTGVFEPFLCDLCIRPDSDDYVVMRVNKWGLFCPVCGSLYQDWVWAFMADRSWEQYK